jgi:hypothetical protein
MLSSPQLTSESVDADELRARLRKMNDADLIAFGKAARYMCSPKANLGKPPRPPFVIQLREARAEWRRRKDVSLQGLACVKGTDAIGQRE